MLRTFILCLICQIYFLFAVYGQQPASVESLSGASITPSEQTQSQKTLPVKIALILPMTGKFRQIGIELAQSMLITQNFLESLQSNSDFASAYHLDIRLKNGACHAGQARKIAKEIVAQHDIMFVIGHYCSVASLAAAPIYSDAGIIQITPFSTNSKLTERNYRTFFRLAGRSDRYGRIAASWLSNLMANHKLGIIYADDTYGKALSDNVITGLAEQYSVTPEKERQIYFQTPIKFKKYEHNLNLLADKFIKDKVTLVYFGGYYTDLARLVNLTKKRGLNIQYVTAGSAHFYDFWQLSNGNAKDIIFTFTKDFSRDISGKERNKALISREFNTYSKKHSYEDAVRKYGIQASRSIFDKNKSYKDRANFIKAYYKEYQKFPDAYMMHLYATMEIIKDIILYSEFEDNFNLLRQKKLSDVAFKNFGYELAQYIKDKGYSPNEENIGFTTLLGPVNFSQTGEWDNIEYVFYQWIDKPQERIWLSPDPTETFIGPRGDYIRLF